jgi:hypothetical protein
MRDAVWLSELGPYALFILFAAYIILKDFGVFRGKNGKNGGGGCYLNKVTEERIANIETLCYDLKKKTDELHKWHDMVDSDGVKIWYVRKSLEDAIVKLADNIAVQTEIMREIVVSIKKTDEDVQKIKDGK